MITIITAYLIGYFISFGLVIGVFEKPNFSAYTTAIVVSLLSWVNIGLYMADFIKEKIKP